MKTKLEMAHEFMLAMIKAGCHDGPDLLDRAWQYADAMQAETEKRNIKLEEDPSNFSGIMKAKVDAELYGNGFVKLKIVNNEFLYERLDPTLITINHIEAEEWQPDWSVAPDGYDWFAVDKKGTAYFYTYKPETIESDEYWADFTGISSNGTALESGSSFGYTGYWRESLRKRPQ